MKKIFSFLEERFGFLDGFAELYSSLEIPIPFEFFGMLILFFLTVVFCIFLIERIWNGLTGFVAGFFFNINSFNSQKRIYQLEAKEAEDTSSTTTCSCACSNELKSLLESLEKPLLNMQEAFKEGDLTNEHSAKVLTRFFDVAEGLDDEQIKEFLSRHLLKETLPSLSGMITDEHVQRLRSKIDQEVHNLLGAEREDYKYIDEAIRDAAREIVMIGLGKAAAESRESLS